MKLFWLRFIEAFKIFWSELFEKRVSQKGEDIVSDNMILTNSRVEKGDPFSRTSYVLMNKPVVFENDIVKSTYHIIKVRKSDYLGIRFDLENVVTGHIARRVPMHKLRGLTSFEDSKLKEHLS